MKLLKTNYSGLSKSLDSISFPKFLFFLLLTILFSNLSQEGFCAQITLTWDPNTETDLAGYDIYYGTSSGNYQSKTDVGNVTTYTVNGLNVGVTYYLTATAYNTQGLESGFSNEVIYTVPSCTYTISPSSASFSTSGGSGSVTVTTQAGCNWGTSTRSFLDHGQFRVRYGNWDHELHSLLQYRNNPYGQPYYRRECVHCDRSRRHHLPHHRLRRSGRIHFSFRADFRPTGGREDLHHHPQ